MPLKPGKANIGDNISEMEAAGHPHDQSVAAAMREAGVKKHSESSRKGVSSRTLKGSERVPQRVRHSKPASGNPTRQDRSDLGTDV